MSDTEFGVSYIAESPEELKVGDRVEVDNGEKGKVTALYDKDVAYVLFDNEMYNGLYDINRLRKLPDTGNPLDKQVGGNHYKKYKIEPVEYVHANGLDFFQGSIVKYITRFRDKDGKKDLEMIRHFIEVLIQLEYPD